MRYFFLFDYQDWLLAVFMGLVLAILIYLAFRSFGYVRGRVGKGREETHHYAEGIEGSNFPPPPFVVFVILGWAVWMVFYVIFIGLVGGPI